MKESFLFLTAIVILTTSCNNQIKQAEQTGINEDSSKTGDNKIMIPASSCYASTIGKDTVLLKVDVFTNVVTGNLSYKFYEKDNNTGELEGQLRGDTLFADYKFLSEGIISTREVIFLIKDDIAIEGYGDMEDKGGKMAFKDRTVINFSGIKLKKQNCSI